MKSARRSNWLAAAEFSLPWRTVCLALFCVASVTGGQEAEHPLKPADRSSPRAALQSFLEAGDTLGAFLTREHIPSPSCAKFQVLLSQAKTTIESLELSEVPPAARMKRGRAAALATTRVEFEAPPSTPNLSDYQSDSRVGGLTPSLTCDSRAVRQRLDAAMNGRHMKP